MANTPFARYEFDAKDITQDKLSQNMQEVNQKKYRKICFEFHKI